MLIDSASFVDYWKNVRHRPSRYPGHSAELAADLPAVRAYVARAHCEAVAVFGALSPEEMAARCLTPAGAPITVWKWLRAMVEHEAHHRGQLYMMAAMRGHRVAPLFGLTEEQVLSLSTTTSPASPAS